MEMIICNQKKGQLETIKVAINETNTTWFDECLKAVVGGILIIV